MGNFKLQRSLFAAVIAVAFIALLAALKTGFIATPTSLTWVAAAIKLLGLSLCLLAAFNAKKERRTVEMFLFYIVIISSIMLTRLGYL